MSELPESDYLNEEEKAQVRIIIGRMVYRRQSIFEEDNMIFSGENLILKIRDEIPLPESFSREIVINIKDIHPFNLIQKILKVLVEYGLHTPPPDYLDRSQISLS